jgi:hypothetical protein
MKKLSSYYALLCKAQNGVVRPTGFANEAMVVSAREEAKN